MSKRKKTHLVEIHEEQIVACLTNDAEIIIANVLADLRNGYFQTIESSLESLASLNRVLRYYGGAQVDFKMPKKYVKAINQSMASG